MVFHPSTFLFRRATVTIPKLSPTHTRAKIVKFLVGHDENRNAEAAAAAIVTQLSSSSSSESLRLPPLVEVECYTPVFIVQCSPDLVTEGYRKHIDHEPFMLIESQEEGTLHIYSGSGTDNGPIGDGNKMSPPNIQLNEWYPVGTKIGIIDDGDDDDGDDDEEWLWQAYSHDDDDNDEEEEADK